MIFINLEYMLTKNILSVRKDRIFIIFIIILSIIAERVASKSKISSYFSIQAIS